MAIALIVDDEKTWQGIHQRKLEGIIGEGNVDTASNYNDASNLLEANNYDLYVIDGEFPRNQGLKAESLGLEFAAQILEEEGSYAKVCIVSGRDSVLDKAQELGIITYTKGLANPDKGYRDIQQLEEDVRQLLQL